jgi:peroxiredoxin
MTLTVLTAILPWLIVCVAFWLTHQLIQQNGRILLSLEVIQAKLSQLVPDQPSGLPEGLPAPPFELPDQNGNLVSLQQFRGRKVLLIFWSPSCGFCQKMAPELAQLPLEGSDDKPLPVLISTNEPEENKQMAEEFGIRCPLLLDDMMKVSSMYKSGGTPTGYLIDDKGVIASELAIGAQVLLALIHAPTSNGGGGNSKDGSEDNDRGKGEKTQKRPIHELHVPIKAISEQGIGVGEVVKRITNAMGFKTCQTCEQRRQKLNRWVIKGTGNVPVHDPDADQRDHRGTA